MNGSSGKNGNKCTKFFSNGRSIKLVSALLVLLICIAALIACRRRSNERSESNETVSPSAVEAGMPERRFPEGCLVDGTDIGGLSFEEAKERLSPAVHARCEAYECRLSFDGMEYTIRSNALTMRSDIQDVLERAIGSGAGDHSVMVFPADDLRLLNAVAAVAEKLDRAPKEAELLPVSLLEGETVLESNARFAVTAPVDGVKVDREAVMRRMLDGETQFELPVSAVPAGENRPKLPARLAICSTSFAAGSLGGANRVSNITKAASLLNARSLAAGESLSCDAALGERTAENGWLPATAFASGGTETVQAPGGGICQVSTTLYNCALLAGMDITERHGHSRKVSYAPGGLDAALSAGTADLVIRNRSSERIYIFMWADMAEKRLCCEIYGGGFPAEYDEIRLETELIETIEPTQPEFTADPSLPDGECVLLRKAITGSRCRTFRIYLKNGAEVRRETVDETLYLMHPALYAVNGG